MTNYKSPYFYTSTIFRNPVKQINSNTLSNNYQDTISSRIENSRSFSYKLVFHPKTFETEIQHFDFTCDVMKGKFCHLHQSL